MATIAQTERRVAVGDERFFLIGGILMALVLVGGFAFHLAMGRSTFASPWPVHVHAFTFFGWTALYVTQTVLATTGHVETHRKLGRLAALWIPLMIVVGVFMTVRAVRLGTVPFFFEPGYFLFMSTLSLFGFVGLAVAAVINRKRTQWHRRLMFCGMAMLTSPGWGRLLPMPLLIPWAGWVSFAATMLFPIAGAAADLMRNGKVHSAWWWGMGVMAVIQLAIVPIADSGLGLGIYQLATQGSAGAAIDPGVYPPFPAG